MTSIENDAFAYCGALTSITVADGNTTYTSKSGTTECNAIIEKSSNTLIRGCNSTVIPTSVTAIGNSAFSRCNGLASITIPANVTSIGESAFDICTNLAQVIFERASLTTYGEGAFDTYSENLKIYVPVAGVDTYAEKWSGYAAKIKAYLDVEVKGGKYSSYYFTSTSATRKLTWDSSDIKVYTVTGTNDNTVTIGELSYVESDKPFLFTGTADGTVRMMETETVAENPEAYSGFKGTAVATEMSGSDDSKTYYVCDGTKFVKVRGEGTIAANRCWLEVGGVAPANRRSIVIGGEGTTAVDEAISVSENETDEGAWYDMNGRKLLGKPAQKGLYIHNGRKVVIK